MATREMTARMPSYRVVYRDRWTGQTQRAIVFAWSSAIVRRQFDRGPILDLYECDGWSGEPVH